MTPETRAKLEQKLNEHGLTVLMTRDYDTVLMQLARLAQFERLMLLAAAGNPVVEFAVDHVQREQGAVDDDHDFAVPMEVINIPYLLAAVNVALQRTLDKGIIHPNRLTPAVSAFITILCRR